MGNKSNKPKFCVCCKSPNVTNQIELTLEHCNVCYKCDKSLEEQFPTNGRKEYLNDKRCDFCPYMLTRRRYMRQSLPVCRDCNDHYHSETVRYISKLITGRDVEDKNITMRYVCIICDVRYNKLTEKELKTIKYEHRSNSQRLASFYIGIIKDDETMLPYCHLCTNSHRYLRKSKIYIS